MNMNPRYYPASAIWLRNSFNGYAGVKPYVSAWWAICPKSIANGICGLGHHEVFK